MRSSNVAKSGFFFFGLQILVCFFYFILYFQGERLDGIRFVFSLIILTLGTLPFYLFITNDSERRLLPLLPLHGLFYSLTFGLTALSEKNHWLNVDSESINYALGLTIVGIFSLYFGYYAGSIVFRRIRPVRFPVFSYSIESRIGWFLFSAYSVFVVFPVLRSIPSVEQLYWPLGLAAVGTLSVLFFSGRMSFSSGIVFGFAVVFTFAVNFLSGSLAPAVLLVVFIGIIYWNVKRSLPWMLILLAVVFSVLINPVKSNYRDVTWYAGEADLSYYVKATRMYDVVVDYYSGDTLVNSISDDSTTINRLAHISTFAYVVSMTPDSIPFWGGESYKTLLTSFIPRIIWPGKPKSTIGQQFGHRYELIGAQDYWTSINLPWIIEFYANFGSLGVLVGMSFIGVFFRYLVHKFSVQNSSASGYSISLTLVFGLFYAESNFALMVGGLLSTFVVFSLILFSVKYLSRKL